MENEPADPSSNLATSASEKGAAENSAGCVGHAGWLAMQPDGTPFAVFFVHSKQGAWLSLSVAKALSEAELTESGWQISPTTCC
jgi:hypothetical protein